MEFYLTGICVRVALETAFYFSTKDAPYFVGPLSLSHQRLLSATAAKSIVITLLLGGNSTEEGIACMYATEYSRPSHRN